MLISAAVSAYAVPARRVLIPYQQPDGTTVMAMPMGDEFGHYYLSEDGKPMMTDQSGAMRYVTVITDGKLAMSEQAATAPSMRTAATQSFVSAASEEKVAKIIGENADKRRELRATPTVSFKAPAKAAEESSKPAQYGMGRFTGLFPRKGDIKSLVFLVEYQDVEFRIDNPHEYFSNMLNQEGFSEYNATGSARDYFLDQSNGEFRPTFDVFGPVKLPQNMSYYGGNDMWGSDQRPEKMVTDAAQLLKDEIDFSQYDLDEDGYVDNIYVIYAGLGEASGGSASSVWPHNYNVSNGPTYNGKIIRRYACSNEIMSGRPDGIGTFCHEFSHVMGLPDLYATSGSLTCTPGVWAIMDQGSYNNNSRTPPNYSIFERNALEWMEPIVVDEPISIQLESIDRSNSGYLIQTSKENEFFLIENRQNRGWDQYIPGHGMLIWHIDYVLSVWDGNRVNNTRTHQYVDIVEANNRTSTNTTTMAGYSFPGNSLVGEFTADTTPAFVDWAGNAIDYPITNINEENGIIYFDISGGTIVFDTIEAPEATVNEDGSMALTWKPVEKAAEYQLRIWTKDAEGNDAIFNGYEDFSVGNDTIYTIAGLASETEYFASVRARNGKTVSDYSEATSVVTPKFAFEYSTPVALGCTYFENGTATFNWEPLPDAVSYLLSVDIETFVGDKTTTYGFGETDDVQASIPEGWVWTGKNTDIYTSASTGFFGEAAPSLKFATNGAYLTSALSDVDMKHLAFWFRGASASFRSTFDVEARQTEEDEWAPVLKLTNLNNFNRAGSIQEADLPEGSRQIRFVYTKAGGNVVIDDVAITADGRDFLPYITKEDVKDALTYNTAIPDTTTAITFYVEAVDANGAVSRPSNRISIRTDVPGGIVGTPAVGDNVHVFGNTVVYQGEAGGALTVYNLSGNQICRVVADASGYAEAVLPEPGVYIAATPSGASKIYISSK